ALARTAYAALAREVWAALRDLLSNEWHVPERGRRRVAIHSPKCCGCCNWAAPRESGPPPRRLPGGSGRRVSVAWRRLEGELTRVSLRWSDWSLLNALSWASPASVTRVSARLSAQRWGRSLRRAKPAPLTRVRSRLSTSRLLRLLRCGIPSSLTRVPSRSSRR